MNTFKLKRSEDVSGVSGTGFVAEGVLFSNGRVALCWLTETPTVTSFDSIADVETIHGHEGRTKIVWDKK